MLGLVWQVMLPSLLSAQTTTPCDYTTASVTLNSVGGTVGGTVRYVLADANGLIRQLSSTPTFAGLTGNQTYTALAISHDGTAAGLSVGSAVSAVSASCFAWSQPLSIRVCVAEADSDGDGVTDASDRCPGTPSGTLVNAYGCPRTTLACSFTTGSFSLSSSGGSGGGTVRYVLADSVGIIRQVSSTPTFSNLSGSKTYMALAISHDGTATNLSPGQALSAVSATCYDWSDGLTVRVCVSEVDTDGDGVVDSADLCPETPRGTAINAYGCPVSLTSCDYTSSNIRLNSTATASSSMDVYVLTDSTGRILQINNQPEFGGLSGSHTYMVAALRYEGLMTGLTVGQPLNGATAPCYDWSDALVVRVCVPVSEGCDYTVGQQITLLATNPALPAGAQTRFILVNAGGIILQLNSTPTFATSGLVPGVYFAYGAVFTDVQSLTNLSVGNQLSAVRGECISLSDPLSIRLCADCQPTCIPITLKRIR